jgi:hypothetical protein
MASSIREKMAEQEKAKKVARRNANAVEAGVKPADNQPKRVEASVGGVSAEASSSDIVKTVSKKKKAPVKKKASKKS